MNILIFILEILGTVAFSVSGVLVALRKKMDLFGVLILGLVTAVGGGIARDILLGQFPPKSLQDPTLPLISLGTSLSVFLLFKWVKGKEQHNHSAKLLFLMDSIGLGVFTVVGIEASQSLYGFNVFLNLCMGTLTGVGGGVLRDLFSCQIPVIFTKHIYATASMVGAGVYCALYYLANPLFAGIAAMVSILILRLLASKFLWDLPKAEWHE